MAFTLTFLPLCFSSQMALMFLVMPSVLRSLLIRTLPLSLFCPCVCVFDCVFHGHTHRHSQAVNGAPVWCCDCAGQCAPLCDCMPPRLRLSLDTSQPSRPADLYPTVTLSERHRETEREGKSEGIASGTGGDEKRGCRKVKGCHKVREQIERRGKRRERETESERTCRQERGGWRGEKRENEGAMRLWIIQNELKGGRDRRRGEIGSGSH